MRRDDTLRILASQGDALKARGVKSLFIFGSVARDEARPDSDVDILVEFEQPVGMFEFLRLERHLSEILGARVDLAMPDALHRRLRDQILSEAIRAA